MGEETHDTHLPEPFLIKVKGESSMQTDFGCEGIGSDGG